jgi:hypothetical protein
MITPTIRRPAAGTAGASAAAAGGATSPYNSDVDGDTEAEDLETQGDHHDSEIGSADDENMHLCFDCNRILIREDEQNCGCK